MQFARLGDAVVVHVLPKAQTGKNCIAWANATITVAAVGLAVVFCQDRALVIGRAVGLSQQ